MIVAILIISVCALAVSIIALIKACKKGTNSDNVKVVKDSAAPIMESPFTYDAEKHQYVLDGNLNVKGGVSCLYSATFGEE